MKDLPHLPPQGKPPLDKGGPGAPPPGWKPPMADISWVKRKFLDVPYATASKAQCLDLYLPEEGDGPFPLLIHIHGGGFALGDKRDDHMDAYLTGIRRGMAVASVEYRLSGEAAFPAAVLDCREALRYLAAHAARFSVDPNRIAVIGGSAGGNLAAMLGMNIPNGAFPGEEGGTYAPLPVVRAAIDQFGPMNFKSMDEQARRNGVSIADHDEPFSPESQYLGMPVAVASQEVCDRANPASYAGAAMCALLVQHGTADKLVPYAQSEEFVATLRAKGLGERVTFVPIEGADHEDKLFVADENMNLVFDFIAAQLH
ncbi:MAG: alpha/beta hydrolase fold domain-containing protein [Oscillospiraceae bacterium]